jgi:DNA-binding SARP family transcriptional activator
MTQPEVEIFVLGPIDIRGAAHRFSRKAARELAVYLAFHRSGVRNDVWADALWPDRRIATPTMHSTSSDARRALGRSVTGAEHLPRLGRSVRLEDSVGTDVEQFARAASSTDPRRWKEALGLVRGRLFEGMHMTDWAVLDGTQAEVESMVVTTALRGAEHCLRHGLGEEAEWMVRRALRASPYDERLYRALLRAAECQGNPSGIRSAMSDLLSVMGESGDAVRATPFGKRYRPIPLSIHPQTLALYRELAHDEVPGARGGAVRL